MTPATIIREAQVEGVKLALSPSGTIKVTGDSAAVKRWLAAIREQKAEIIEALKGIGDTGAASRWWRLHFTDRSPLEVSCTPATTRAEMLKGYPTATSAGSFVMPAGRQATPDEARELRQLVAMVCADYPADELAEALELALGDADDALRCYRSLASRRTA